MTIFIALVLIGMAAALRFLPNRLANRVLGGDHWYWKSYIEKYRTTKQCPPHLPQYLLDQHQWYPPVFPLVLAAMPDWLFDRYNQTIAIAIDLSRMMLVLAASFWISGGDTMAVVLAGVLYASSPILVSYNTQLNPRGLGALLLDLLVCLIIWTGVKNASFTLWGIAALLAGGMLLTHKMTAQLFWFLCGSFGLVLAMWQFVLLIPLSIAAALILSRGFYLNVLKAHWDIVTFWNRNWRWLQAHPLKESPIYGEPSYETPTRFYRSGVRGWGGHVRYLLGFNPGAWVLAAAGAANVASLWDTPFGFIVLWGDFILLFALFTLCIPFIRCLGSGYFYLYNAAFPVSLAGALLSQRGQPWGLVAWLAVAANVAALVAYYRTVVTSKRPQFDGHFDEVLKFLKRRDRGNVMCLPLQWSDLVAYKTGQPVLTGGHGYGFKLFEPLFPRLMMPIQEVIRQFEVRYLVTMEGYLPERFRKDMPPAEDNQFGHYHVYITKP